MNCARSLTFQSSNEQQQQPECESAVSVVAFAILSSSNDINKPEHHLNHRTWRCTPTPVFSRPLHCPRKMDHRKQRIPTGHQKKQNKWEACLRASFHKQLRSILLQCGGLVRTQKGWMGRAAVWPSFYTDVTNNTHVAQLRRIVVEGIFGVLQKRQRQVRARHIPTRQRKHKGTDQKKLNLPCQKA